MTTDASDPASGAAGIPSALKPDDLRAQRESLNVSARELAHRLRMQVRQVEALERGEWAALPGLAFVRGALRNYGRAVGIDVQPLLDSIGGFAQTAEMRPAGLDTPFPTTTSTFEFRSGRRSNRSWLLWAIVGVIGVVAIAYYLNTDPNLARLSESRPGGSGGTTTETIDANGTRVTTTTLSGQAPPASPVAPATPAMTGAAALPGPAAASDSGAAAAPDAGAPAAAIVPDKPAASAGPRLTLQFAQDAWVDIRETSSNRILYFGTAKAGTSQSYSDAGPLKMTLGNVNQVRIEVNGKPYDPKAATKDNVARFTLKD